MTTASNSRVMRTIPLILIVVVWPFAHASAEPPTEWQGPVGWWSGDIGTTGGSAVQSGDTFEITSDGHDIGGTADGFHFMFKELKGKGSITARVVSNGTGSDTWAKGGVMIRDDISPSSTHVMTVITGGAGGGAAFQWRVKPDRISGSAHDPIPSVSPPYWVRIERRGNRLFSSYLSSDGRTWRQQGTTKTIAIADPVYIGLCVTSHDAGSLRTYTFDNISYTGHVTDRPLNLVVSQPIPGDGTICTNNWVNLSWMPGDLASLHNVYFGTDLNAVAQRKTSVLIATTDVPFVSVGLPGFAFPNGLQMGTTYYWCVDAFNDSEPDSPWLGEVWSLTISTEPAVYLLITNEELAPAFQPLVDRRTMQGFPGRLLTVENIYATYLGADEPERIRNCIVNHYVNYETQYVALGGDDVIVPVRYCFPYEPEGDPVPADIYYSDMDGGNWDTNGNGVYGERGDVGESELTPEVCLGRIPVRTTEQTTAYINKVVTYETALPDRFSDSMIIFGGSSELWSGTERPVGFQHHDPVSRREVGLACYYLDLIQPYWQAVPFHLYCDTSTPWDMVTYGDYGFSVEALVNHLNQGPAGLGYHFVLFSGHANYVLYGLGQGGRFNTAHASALTNTLPSIFISGGCAPAGFDRAEPCLSEALLRNPTGGAVAFFGYARSVSDGSHRNQIFQTIFRDRPTVLGEAIFNCKATLASRYAGKPYHHYMFNLQGDPLIHLMPDESGRRLQLFQPRGCEVIKRGSDLYIRWNAAGTGFTPDEKAKLEYSPDSERTWYVIPHAEALPYDESLFIWEDCNLPSGSAYRMRVTSLSDPRASDTSARDFTIADLGLLAVQSRPVTGLTISGSFERFTNHNFVTNFDISVPKGQGVTLTVPVVPESMPELLFAGWADEAGNVMSTVPDYTFTFTHDTVVVAEYDCLRDITHYYVNDETAEYGVSVGDDRNDGLSPGTAKRHIKAILDAYPGLGIASRIRVSAGVYEENLGLDADNTGLEIVGAGQDSCIIDGGGRGSCITLDDLNGGLISGFTIQNGSSDRGGGIHCRNSSVVIRECMFSNNTANTYGGGIFVRSSSPDISNCAFVGNIGARGGGVCDYGGASVIRKCLFEANNATLYGGGFYNTSAGKPNLKNCVFYGNSARRGGAVTVTADSSHTAMVNCTLGSNPARSGNREVIWIAIPEAAMELRDCILYDSAAPTATLITAEGTLGVQFSLIKGARGGINEGQTANVNWGPGNIDADPLFADPSNGDFHLKSQAGHWEPENRLRWIEDNATSPCIDAGDPLSTVGDEPEPNGGRINMGAYGGTAEASKSL